MFMKQDIWRIYFQTCIRNGFNVPESADHHSAEVSVARLVRASPLYVPLQWSGKFLGGRGCLWELRGGRVMSCCNNKQILMIYYKSAAEASAWGDWGGWQLLTHTPRKCLADDVCALQIINHWARTHTQAHTLLQKHAFNTRTQVYRPTYTHVRPHTCSLLLMPPLLWQGTNQSRVQKFKGVRDCLVRFSLCYWSHFTGIIAKLSHKPRDSDGLKVDDWERR